MKDNKMTWEETIQYIRPLPEYKYLVEKAYFEENLSLNVERFRISEEYVETLQLIKKYQPHGKKILDIGCGNGISSISLALDNYDVTAVEPDSSLTVGAGAVRQLKEHYNLSNVQVYEAFAEDIKFENESFDIVYIRQAMHHSYDLNKFIGECGRVLKKGGLLITVRDHVVFNEKDKEWFLASHPLQKYYGGENAFSPEQYQNAMNQAGLNVVQQLKFYDSVINYFPMTKAEFDEMPNKILENHKNRLKNKINFLANLPFIFDMYKILFKAKIKLNQDEMDIPGRMYSYLAIKS